MENNKENVKSLMKDLGRALGSGILMVEDYHTGSCRKVELMGVVGDEVLYVANGKAIRFNLDSLNEDKQKLNMFVNNFKVWAPVDILSGDFEEFMEVAKDGNDKE